MATPAEKLAESLEALQTLQNSGMVAIKTNALTRTNRERLLANGFVKEIYKGWYIIVSPNETKGDTTSWYSSYWQFCSQVLEDMYQDNWCISPEQNAGEVADSDHGDWYRELFAPGVTAGILKPSDLAGYRNQQVYISRSKHVPFNKEAVRDAMPALFDLLKEEPEASVRAVLGHFIFVFIHPYMDGNGRMGRFLMNVMLSSGGYPWTVIPVEERDTYMSALENASVGQNIKPFATFLGRLLTQSLKGTPVAKI